MTSLSFAFDVAWSVALALRFSAFLIADASLFLFNHRYFFLFFFGRRLGCGDSHQNRVGEADGTGWASSSKIRGIWGRSSPPWCVEVEMKWRWRRRWRRAFLHQQDSRLAPCLSFPHLPCSSVLRSVLAANCTHEHVEKLIHHALHRQVSLLEARASIASSKWFCRCVNFKQRMFPLA